jgi:hypothetical protein
MMGGNELLNADINADTGALFVDRVVTDAWLAGPDTYPFAWCVSTRTGETSLPSRDGYRLFSALHPQNHWLAWPVSATHHVDRAQSINQRSATTTRREPRRLDRCGRRRQAASGGTDRSTDGR